MKKNRTLGLLSVLAFGQALLQGAETPAAMHPPLLLSSYTNNAAYIVSADDKVVWKTDLPGACQDAWLLDDGNVLVSGGNVVKVVRPDNSVVWQYVGLAGQPIEIHSCQPLPGGGAVFGEGGTARIIEVDRTGKQVKEVKLPLKGSAHEQMRQVRKLANGHYLVCGMGENNLYEFDPEGKVVRLVEGKEMKNQGLNWHCLHSADLLANGNLLVGGGYNSSLAEIDPAGKVVWNLTKEDVPEMGFNYAAGSQRLSDGTTVVAAYHGGVPVFAVSQDKKVLWTCKNQEMGKPSHVKVLDDGQVAPFIKAVLTQKLRNAASTEVAQALAAVDFLSKTYPDKYNGEGFRSKLEAAEKRLRDCAALPANDVTMKQAGVELEQFQALRREALFANPLLDFQKILFIKRDFLPPSEKSGNHMCDQYFGFHARPGGGLFVLDDAFGPAPKARNILSDSICSNGRFSGKKLTSAGGFLSPSLSYNAKDVLFSYTEIGKPNCYEWTPEGAFHIFKVGVDGSKLAQLTDGPTDDIDPCWLPNGRIAFMSERRGGYGRCHGRPVPVYTLHSMNADGSDIVCLSYHESNEWQPSVTNDGMIIYTRWDYVDRGFNQAHHPWITTPDGCDPRALQGNYASSERDRPMMEMDIRAIPGSRKFVATAAAHHGQAYGSLVMIDPQVEDDDKMAPIKVITPDTAFPEATTSSALGQRYATAWPLSEQFFLCVYDPEGRAGRGTSNNFGIYLIDSFGNRELIYKDPAISCLSPIPLKVRPVPPVVPNRSTEGVPAGDEATGDSGKTARVGLVNVYDSLKPLPANTSIKALRVIELLSKSTPRGNSPRIGYGHQKNCRAVLGTVPVEPDGSAFFNVPVHRPIYFQALDESGLAVQSMRSDTYLHSGEMLTCQGCHNPVHRAAPPKKSTPAAFRRAPSEITPEPEGSHPFSFPRLVQPVLDRKCVACHAEKNALDLSMGDPEKNKTEWFTSYANLEKFAFFYDDVRFTTPRTIPGEFGAKASKLLKIIDGDHYGLKLSPEDRRRITLWLDCNSDFFGNFQHTAEQLKGEVVPVP
ncbi:MAG: PQQ-binding-like beta-propeller repeat protein [Verrucomicrobiae bacterium]